MKLNTFKQKFNEWVESLGLPDYCSYEGFLMGAYAPKPSFDKVVVISLMTDGNFVFESLAHKHVLELFVDVWFVGAESKVLDAIDIFREAIQNGVEITDTDGGFMFKPDDSRLDFDVVEGSAVAVFRLAFKELL